MKFRSNLSCNELQIFLNSIKVFDVRSSTINIPFFFEPFEYDIQLQCGIVNPNKDYVVLNKGLHDDKGTRGKMYIKFSIKYPEYHMLNNNEIQLLNDVLNTLNIK